MIQEWHQTKNGPTPAQAAKVILRLAEIVGFAHRLNPPIVHRDLKPANILVQRSGDGKIQFKVADFGIGGVAVGQAIRETSHGTSRGGFLTSAVHGAYTPLYASPQQMRGEPPDTRDDVYSLGVIWYQLLTGDLASGCPTGSRWRTRLSEQGMRSETVELLEHCFEDTPDDRPSDAAELARLLKGITERSSSPSRIRLSVWPPSLTMATGSSEQVVVRVDRENFDGSLTVSVENLPATLNARTSPIPIRGTVTQVLLTADNNALPKTINAHIVARGDGVQDTVMLPVHVIPKPDPPAQPVKNPPEGQAPRRIKMMGKWVDANEVWDLLGDVEIEGSRVRGRMRYTLVQCSPTAPASWKSRVGESAVEEVEGMLNSECLTLRGLNVSDPTLLLTSETTIIFTHQWRMFEGKTISRSGKSIIRGSLQGSASVEW